MDDLQQLFLREHGSSIVVVKGLILILSIYLSAYCARCGCHANIACLSEGRDSKNTEFDSVISWQNVLLLRSRACLPLLLVKHRSVLIYLFFPDCVHFCINQHGGVSSECVLCFVLTFIALFFLLEESFILLLSFDKGFLEKICIWKETLAHLTTSEYGAYSRYCQT